MYDILAALAVWRITSLLVDEEGPFDVFEKLRWAVGLKPGAEAKTFLQKTFSCAWCMSVYVALPFALFSDHFIIAWLGYSGGAILIHSVIDR
jgi:hypothetical protein